MARKSIQSRNNPESGWEEKVSKKHSVYPLWFVDWWLHMAMKISGAKIMKLDYEYLPRVEAK
jgi:hypothetical protein